MYLLHITPVDVCSITVIVDGIIVVTVDGKLVIANSGTILVNVSRSIVLFTIPLKNTSIIRILKHNLRHFQNLCQSNLKFTLPIIWNFIAKYSALY